MNDENGRKIKRTYPLKIDMNGAKINPTICEEHLKGRVNGNLCEIIVIEYEDGHKEFGSAKHIGG